MRFQDPQVHQTQDNNDNPGATSAAQAAQAQALIDRSATIKNLRVSYRNAMVLHEFDRANKIIKTLADLDSEIAWEEAKDIQSRWRAGLTEADAHVKHLRDHESETDNQKRTFSERDSPEATPTTSKVLKSSNSGGPPLKSGRRSLGNRKSLDAAKKTKSDGRKDPNGPNNFKQGDARGVTRYPTGAEWRFECDIFGCGSKVRPRDELVRHIRWDHRWLRMIDHEGRECLRKGEEPRGNGFVIIGVDRTPGKEMWRGTFMDGGPKFCCGRMVHDDDPDDIVTHKKIKDDQKNAETHWENDRIGEWDGHDWAVENGAEEPGAAYVPTLPVVVGAADNEDNTASENDDTNDGGPSRDHTPRKTRQKRPGTTSATSAPHPDVMAAITTAHRPEFEQTFGTVTPSTIPTNGNDRRCGLHALVLSMAAQHPGLPTPTLEKLATIGRNTLFATENFVGHEMAYIIQQWGQQIERNLNIQFGWLLEGRGPVLYPTAGMPSAQGIILWVHNDDHFDQATMGGRDTTGLYNQWSGLGHRQG